MPTLLALFQIPANLGYLALAGLVGSESMGVPVPGETALIAAALLAQAGQLNIVAVIAVAAAAAIVGDNLGYAIGRSGGRRLLSRPGFLERYRRELLERGEPFFERHGPKAVFLGRWVAALRIGAAWLAGITHMRWPVFVFWNAAGGIAWATSVGLVAYLLGPAAAQVIKDVGLAGAVVVVIAGIGYLLRRRRTGKRGGEGARR